LAKINVSLPHHQCSLYYCIVDILVCLLYSVFGWLCSNFQLFSPAVLDVL
jgi:hypothetical protein